MITIKEIKQIFDDTNGKWEGDNAFKGLQILSKYTDRLIRHTEHCILYSVEVDEIIELGITKEDIMKLALLNWMVDQDHLACFV